MKQYIANISFEDSTAFYNAVASLSPDPKYIPIYQGYIQDFTADYKITVSDEDLVALKLKFSTLIAVQYK